MNHFNKESNNDLIVITKSYEENEELYEKAAEMVLSQSFAMFQKEKLLEQIDLSLINRDEELFMNLTKQYKNLLSQHHFLT